jgi:hypothetical protein
MSEMQIINAAEVIASLEEITKAVQTGEAFANRPGYKLVWVDVNRGGKQFKQRKWMREEEIAAWQEGKAAFLPEHPWAPGYDKGVRAVDAGNIKGLDDNELTILWNNVKEYFGNVREKRSALKEEWMQAQNEKDFLKIRFAADPVYKKAFEDAAFKEQKTGDLYRKLRLHYIEYLKLVNDIQKEVRARGLAHGLREAKVVGKPEPFVKPQHEEPEKHEEKPEEKPEKPGVKGAHVSPLVKSLSPDAYKSLIAGACVKKEVLGGGCNKIFKIRVEAPNVIPMLAKAMHVEGDKIKECWKPASGERSLRSVASEGAIHHGTFYKREALAYELSEALGWGLVPPTVIREVDGEIGSAQVWVDGPAGGVADKISDDDRWKGCLFDVISYNTDRHGNNFINGNDGKLYFIDNGLTFAQATPNGCFRCDILRGKYEKGKVPQKLLDDIKNVKWDIMYKSITDLLGAKDGGKVVEGMKFRIDRIIAGDGLYSVARAKPPRAGAKPLKPEDEVGAAKAWKEAFGKARMGHRHADAKEAVRGYMRDKGYPTEDIDDAVDKMERKGFLREGAVIPEVKPEAEAKPEKAPVRRRAPKPRLPVERKHAKTEENFDAVMDRANEVYNEGRKGADVGGVASVGTHRENKGLEQAKKYLLGKGYPEEVIDRAWADKGQGRKKALQEWWDAHHHIPTGEVGPPRRNEPIEGGKENV